MFRCNLPPALLAERLGSLTCHCSYMGVERTPNKSQHRKLTLEKKILPLLLLGFKLATFQSRDWRSTNTLCWLQGHSKHYIKVLDHRPHSPNLAPRDWVFVCVCVCVCFKLKERQAGRKSTRSRIYQKPTFLSSTLYLLQSTEVLFRCVRSGFNSVWPVEICTLKACKSLVEIWSLVSV